MIFESDDGSFDYARRAGIYIDGAEAPLFPDRIVTSLPGHDHGYTVILTFGQSNAANSGDGHYELKAPYLCSMFLI